MECYKEKEEIGEKERTKKNNHKKKLKITDFCCYNVLHLKDWPWPSESLKAELKRLKCFFFNHEPWGLFFLRTSLLVNLPTILWFKKFVILIYPQNILKKKLKMFWERSKAVLSSRKVRGQRLTVFQTQIWNKQRKAGITRASVTKKSLFKKYKN